MLWQDHLLAASTCLYKLYALGTSSYRELAGRREHLCTAIRHLQLYLNHPKGKPRRPGVLKLDPREVERTLRLAGLQLDVADFLTQPALANITEECGIYLGRTNGDGFADGCLPTVLDKNSECRNELCVLVSFSSVKYVLILIIKIGKLKID